MPQGYEDWLAAAVEVQHQHTLEAIVGSPIFADGLGLPDPIFTELAEVFDTKKWKERKREHTINRTLDDYVKTLDSVLGYSGTLTLIDPWMSLETRYSCVVRKYARLLGKNRHNFGNTRKIVIHVGDPQKSGGSLEQIIQEWQRELRLIVDNEKNLSISVFFWSDKERDERFHDRFVITQQCCVEFPGGLDTGRGTTTLALKSKEKRDHELKKFMDAHQAFTRLGFVEVR